MAHRIKHKGVVVSNRQKEIIRLIRRGLSNKEIASILFVTIKTIKFHNTNIFKAHGVSNRIELILKLHNYGG